MKTLKITMLALLAMAFVNLANASTIVVHITGSTAYRPAVHKAIMELLQAGSVANNYTFTNGAKYAYTGVSNSDNSASGYPAASYAIFSGSATVSGSSQAIIIETSWSGSLGGLLTVSKQINAAYLSSSSLAYLTGTGTKNQPTPDTSGTNGDVAVPDLCLSDVYQSSTQFANLPTAPGLTEAQYAYTPVNSNDGGATSGPGLGVVPFEFVIGNGAPSYVTNMTADYARYLWPSGQAPLAFLTGSSADENTIISAVGRDTDSGTRATAFADTGVGINTTVQQYQPVITGGTVTGENLYPKETLYNTIVLGTGNGGYSSGPTLAAVLGAPGSFAADGDYYIGYLSTGDTATAVGLGARALSYQGVPYSATAVEEGQYTFWSYEHMYYYPSAPAVQGAFAQLLANKIGSAYATIELQNMNVNRGSDGGKVEALYF